MSAETPRGNGANPVAVGGRFAFNKHSGDINLLEISEGSDNPRYSVYLSGWAAGWESQQAEIGRLQWERDLLYFLNSNPSKTGADFYALKTTELWDGANR